MTEVEIPITVLVQTKNEEVGIADCLVKLVDFDEVIVVDSDSTDRTKEIAEALGAVVVNFTWNGRYPKKKQWQLDNLNTRNEWVLFIDADESPQPDLIAELRRLFANGDAGAGAVAFDIDLDYVFAGRRLRHGHRVTKRCLVRKGFVMFPEVDDLDAPGMGELEGHYQPEANQSVSRLQGRILHNDLDPVATWFARHNKYSDWEAHLRTRSSLREQIRGRRTLKGRVFDRVPFKPLLFFMYAYFGRVGFLDGRAGFDYALALAMYYWQIGVKARELARREVARMNVVHVTPSYARRDGGSSETLRGLIPELTKLGLGVVTLTTNKGVVPDDQDFVQQNSVKVVRSLPPRSWNFAPGIIIPLWRSISHADVVHIHSVNTFTTTAAMVVARLRRVPYVVEPHGALDAYHMSEGTRKKRLYNTVVDRYGFERVAGLITSSPRESRDAQRAINAPVYEVPLGVDEALFSLARRDNSVVQVLFLGRVARKKRLDLVLYALAADEMRSLDWRLSVAGPVDEDIDFVPTELATELGIFDRVTFMGRVDAEQRALLLAQADIFVLPSEDESFGVAVAEALAAGCTVVTSGNVGIAPSASDAGALIMIPLRVNALSDALSNLMTDVESRQAYAKKAREYSSRFRWATAAIGVSDVYQNVISSRAKRLG